jgi:hypothetical protein
MNLRANTYLNFNNGVVWLQDVGFLHQEDKGQRQFYFLLGKKVNDIHINNFKRNLESNINIKEKYCFKYKHVIFPAKPYVYKNEFKSIGLDIRSIFSSKHKNPFVTYPKLLTTDYDNDDTHVNDEGMIKVVSQFVIDFHSTVLPQPQFKEVEGSGDLGKMCFKKNIVKKVLTGFQGEVNDWTRVERFSLAPFLEGNSGHIDYALNPFARFNKRIILFGDSFFRSKLHIFEMLYSEVIYFRIPYVIEDIIKVLEPDVVLTGNAERYLVSVPDSTRPRPLFLNYFGTGFQSTGIPEATIHAFESLFSGRGTSVFNNFLRARAFNLLVEVKKILEKPHNEIMSSKEIDYYRDSAMSLENIDITIATKLMGVAYHARPNGELIAKKYKEYKRIKNKKGHP